MNTLVVYAHPSSDSFNASILKRVTSIINKLGNYEVRDLNGSNFDPVRSKRDILSEPGSSLPVDVIAEQAYIADANHIVFIYPVWWYGRPAILKGWCDRVLTPEFAYRVNRATGNVEGLLTGKKATVISTSALIKDDSPALEWVTKPMTHGTLKFCGIDDTEALNLLAVPLLDDKARYKFLEEVDDFVATRFAQ